MKAKLMHKVCDATEKCGEVVQVECDGIVIAAELVKCSIEELASKEEVDVDVTFFCHAKYGVYENEEEYYESGECMAAESYIPVGAMSEVHEGDEPSPMNLINLVVKDIVENPKAPEEYLLLHGKVCDATLDVVIRCEDAEEKAAVKPGNIISGLYWAELKLLNK